METKEPASKEEITGEANVSQNTAHTRISRREEFTFANGIFPRRFVMNFGKMYWMSCPFFFFCGMIAILVRVLKGKQNVTRWILLCWR